MTFNINELVTSNKFEGIGCIIGIRSKEYVTVAIGQYETRKLKLKELKHVDTSKCKTVNMIEFQSRVLRDKSKLNDVIVGNELKQYVGIGWISIRTVTEDDLLNYPRVIN